MSPKTKTEDTLTSSPSLSPFPCPRRTEATGDPPDDRVKTDRPSVSKGPKDPGPTRETQIGETGGVGSRGTLDSCRVLQDFHLGGTSPT